MAELIANTSPLQYLHQLGRLDLLKDLFGRVTVPDAVISELAAGRLRGVSLPRLEGFQWIEIAAGRGSSERLLSSDLGSGEVAVLSLAMQRSGSWVVLDDRLAREAAGHLGISCIGTAGILVRAKRAGLLPSVSVELERL